METLNIQIRRNEHGNLSAIFETEDGKAHSFNSLFQFAYRKGENEFEGTPCWCFWLYRGFRASHTFKGERKDFPVEFFLNACRAKYFLHPRGEKLPDKVNITYGLGHIGIRTNKKTEQ